MAAYNVGVNSTFEQQRQVINLIAADLDALLVGVVSSGIATYASTSGISTVSQGLTGTPNITVGVVTATSFFGSGTNLTGIVTSIVAGTGVTISGSTGQVTINSTTTGGSGTFSASAGITTDVDSFAITANNFKTAEYTVYIQSSSSIQAQKVLVMQNGTSAFSQEYGIMYEPNFIVSIGATVSGGSCKLQFTPETGVSGLVTYRFTRETMI